MDLALGDILQGIEIIVGRRHLDAAAPAGRAIVIQAARIGDGRAVDFDLIVVEAFVLRGGVAGPDAVAVVGQVVLDAAEVQFDALCVRGTDLRTHDALGVDHRILAVGLVARGGFEIFFHLGGQGDGRQEKTQGNKDFFHNGIFKWLNIVP